MGKCGDVYANQVTGEHALVLRGDEDGRAGESVLVLLTVTPGGAVAGEHIHPEIQEGFRVLSGSIGVRLDGADLTLRAGQQATASAGVRHDWWNAGDEPARVLVEISPADSRFETMIATLFGLANDGKTNARGMPNLLQLSLIGREFDDVIRFATPPRPIQRAVTAILAPIARARGYRATYPQYLGPHSHTTPEPDVMTAAGLATDPAAAATTPLPQTDTSSAGD